MSADAISRYGSLKSVYLEKAIQSLIVIAQMVQKGLVNEKISDEQYKGILLNLKEEKKEFKITRK